MKLNELYVGDCFDFMPLLSDNTVDVVLTSPPYNTNKRGSRGLTLNSAKLMPKKYAHVRYDIHLDDMTNEQYNDYTVSLFTQFDRILKPNGVVLYNINYGNENTGGMFQAVNAVLERTDFTIADVIVWKKKNAMPNNCSANKLTRLWEFVFVFCRKNEEKGYFCNKKITSRRTTGQPMYENIYNVIEAKNNDGPCPLNKATYSSELCERLLTIYAPKNATVYDPFMGSGTTAVACIRSGLNFLGSEISADQVNFARQRIADAIDDLLGVEA